MYIYLDRTAALSFPSIRIDFVYIVPVSHVNRVQVAECNLLQVKNSSIVFKFFM